MKYILTIIATVSILANIVMSDKISRLENYYEAAENLLDTLENNYNWVDAFDPYDYYEAIENLRR